LSVKLIEYLSLYTEELSGNDTPSITMKSMKSTKRVKDAK
jgi:hypothetical protein